MKLRLALAFCSASLLPSCGQGGRPVLVPVRGQVFLETMPAYKALVWLHPLAPTPPGAVRPHGVVDRDGSFELGTHASRDGAAPGKYKVTVSWTKPGPMGDSAGESLIPFRYMDPARSGLPEVEIQSKATTLPIIRLSRR
jgi:hypothetical protein